MRAARADKAELESWLDGILRERKKRKREGRRKGRREEEMEGGKREQVVGEQAVRRKISGEGQ